MINWEKDSYLSGHQDGEDTMSKLGWETPVEERRGGGEFHGGHAEMERTMGH